MSAGRLRLQMNFAVKQSLLRCRASARKHQRMRRPVVVLCPLPVQQSALSQIVLFSLRYSNLVRAEKPSHILW